METGVQEVRVETESGVEKSRTVTTNYYALEVGNRLLVVKSTGGTMRVAAGALAPMSPDLECNLFGRRGPPGTVCRIRGPIHWRRASANGAARGTRRPRSTPSGAPRAPAPWA